MLAKIDSTRVDSLGNPLTIVLAGNLREDDQDIDETLAAFSAIREKLENKLYPQEMPSVAMPA